MKTYFKTAQLRLSTMVLAFIALSLGAMNTAKAQSSYQAVGPVKVKIEGTSNIHDWEMNADKGNCTAVFALDAKGALSSLSSLSFSMLAESLKSEHSGMDKNAYKAMRTDKYANITYTAAATTIKPAGGANYQIASKGKLTISGVSRDVDITATATVNPDKTISVAGSYKLKMTTFSVTPPSIMFGAIKTGDDITVKFNLLFKAR